MVQFTAKRKTRSDKFPLTKLDISWFQVIAAAFAEKEAGFRPV